MEVRDTIARVRALDGLDIRYADEDVVLICGDNRDVVPKLVEAGIRFESVISDPPYNLTQVSRNGSPRTQGTEQFGRVRLGERGFMGLNWDASEHVFHPEFWNDVLRCCLPGASLFSFGGTRTSHRLTCAIEDAGWEIRDEIQNLIPGDSKWDGFWSSLNDEQRGAYLEAVGPAPRASMAYGSGFPKSFDVSNGIDKSQGLERERIRGVRSGVVQGTFAQDEWSLEHKDSVLSTEPVGDDAKPWRGYGTALKPSYEPIVVAMAPMPGGFARNALEYGVAGLWIDGCRLGNGVDKAEAGSGGLLSHVRDGKPYPGNGREGEAAGNERYKDRGASDFGMPPGPRGGSPAGRWPTNTSLTHHEKCVCVGEKLVEAAQNNGSVSKPAVRAFNPDGWSGRAAFDYADEDGTESVSHWSCAAACECGHVWPCSEEAIPVLCPQCQSYKTDWICPVRVLDAQAGNDHGGGFPQARKSEKTKGIYGAFAEGHLQHGPRKMGKGGVSRFFYTSKASTSERDCGLRGRLPCKACGGVDSVHHLLRREDRAVFGAQQAGVDGIPTIKFVADDMKRLRGKKELRDYPWLLVKCHRNHHPTLKPLAIMTWIARMSRTPTGGVVLDPFAGSGTTGIACLLEDRQCVLIEQDPEYCAIAAARLQACREGAFDRLAKKKTPKSCQSSPIPKPRPANKPASQTRLLFSLEME